ncbi:ABC transporter permease [Paracoccus ravus]|uniref:ABC transporter permease n=1 Tax=Paracoccus ravus TaxID=2447760 RepID=UPI00143040F9|nr:ABC transporter permease [Paracoccus ravus]
MMLRPATVFAILVGLGLWLPLVQFKPNRIAAGEGIRLDQALAGGPVIALAVLGLLVLSCIWRMPDRMRIVLALAGMAGSLVVLGHAARSLSVEAGNLARLAPASGFWLMLLGFSLMLADGVARLGPSLPARWLILGLVLVAGFGILASGMLDQISVMREYATRRAAFLHEAKRHLQLAFGSLGLALLVGLPLGTGIYMMRRLRGPVLAALNILQTIPSLALFGIMLPLLAWLAATLPAAGRWGVSGIGAFPALIALFLYALLPVVSNTLSGLETVPRATREAAVGLGMTRWQVLGQVLIPLALPSLIAALRIVLVQNIGLAVIAGLIGGGGFGTFVFQGLNQMAMDLVLLGTLPTIALALLAGIVLDLLIEHVARGRP